MREYMYIYFFFTDFIFLLEKCYSFELLCSTTMLNLFSLFLFLFFVSILEHFVSMCRCVTITKLQVHRATGRDLSLRLLDAVTNLVIIHNVTVGAVVMLSRVLSISDRERLFFVRDWGEGGGEEEWQPRECECNVSERSRTIFVLGRHYINDFKSDGDAHCFKDSPS